MKLNPLNPVLMPGTADTAGIADMPGRPGSRSLLAAGSVPTDAAGALQFAKLLPRRAADMPPLPFRWSLQQAKGKGVGETGQVAVGCAAAAATRQRPSRMHSATAV